LHVLQRSYDLIQLDLFATASATGWGNGVRTSKSIATSIVIVDKVVCHFTIFLKFKNNESF